MSESEEPGKTPPDEAKKPYATPTLIEYGSVSKLTMAKGSTNSEFGVPNKLRRPCL